MEKRTIPNHIAVIMDGNGRWAKSRLLPRTAGHLAGFDKFVDLVKSCDDLGIKYLTVYAFSTENASRGSDEVSALFSLAAKAVGGYESKLMARNIRGVVVGDIDMAGEKLAETIRGCEERLASNTGMTLCIAFCYGGRKEIISAINKAIKNGEAELTEEAFSRYLYTAGIPDPDLIIRTSGEIRLSNFLLYQSAYSELYFTDVLWPDFDKAQLEKAIDDYSGRKRRYGR
ncbi:MAG: polyprenyl diphosphate synthase [Eubacteriales bacterium]|nr:polyprenyl diphosphate synthase [Eubacteriales bacterium]